MHRLNWILLALTLMLTAISAAEGREPKALLEPLLSSSETSKQREAFDTFTAEPQRFVPFLKESLSFYRDAPLDLDRLNTLFYLAAYAKDTSLVPPIMDILNRFTSSDEQELELGCIYMCPVVFSLVVFDTCTDWKLPPPPSEGYWVLLSDVFRDVELFPNQPLVAKHAKEHFSGNDAWNARMDKVAAMSDMEVLAAASAENSSKDLRFAAAFELQYRTHSSEQLDELYWLAITGEKFERDVNDASMEYRDAICRAIYRAERAKQLGR